MGRPRYAVRVGARLHAARGGRAGDALNRSRLATVVCVPLTSNVHWAEAPGNVLLSARTTNLPKDSVANTSQIVTLDRSVLTERVAKLSRAKLELVLSGIDVVLGR